jgi:hypothetical protein
MARPLAVLAFVVLASLPSLAGADPPRAARANRAPRGEPRVLRIGEIVVPGWIHNPGVVFVLERSRPRFTPKPLERSFLTEVVRSTRGL